MDSENKLPLVKQTLRLLTAQLREQDKVSLVTYAGGEKLVLPLRQTQKETILRVFNKLSAGGATAGEAAIQMAYKEAEKAFVKNGINRIPLATDSDFNVGSPIFKCSKAWLRKSEKRHIANHTGVWRTQLQ